MAVSSKLLFGLGLFVAVTAVLWQLYMRPLLTILGVGRVIQPLSDFPFVCHKLHHPLLRACEDLWLDDEGRTLYLACEDPAVRRRWMPNAGDLDYTGHAQTGSSFVALDIDSLRLADSDDMGSSLPLKRLLPNPQSGFRSVLGGEDASLDLVGFGARRLPDGRLRFHLVNMRPTIDTDTGHPVSGVHYHPSIEEFDLEPGQGGLTHVRTIEDSLIFSPNRVAALPDGGILFTNDHSSPADRPLARAREMLTGGGNVVYCPPSRGDGGAGSPCQVVADEGFNFPNGLAVGRDGLVYVPSAANARIHVMRMDAATNNLTEIETVLLGMSSDNLSVDEAGDVYTASIPSSLSLLQSLSGPTESVGWPSTVFRISRRGDGSGTHTHVKVVEDAHAEAVSGVTTCAHDARTGRLFLSGVLTSFITVCEPKAA